MRLFSTAALACSRSGKCIASDVRRIGTREWAYLEVSSAAVDQGIHNIVLMGVYDGRVLMFNFNSTLAEFPTVAKAMRTSMASIEAKPER